MQNKWSARISLENTTTFSYNFFYFVYPHGLARVTTTFLRGNPASTLMSDAHRAAFWIRSHPLPRALGPGHNSDHCAADEPAASEALIFLPSPKFQERKSLKIKMTWDNKDWNWPLFRKEKTKWKALNYFTSILACPSLAIFFCNVCFMSEQDSSRFQMSQRNSKMQ